MRDVARVIAAMNTRPHLARRMRAIWVEEHGDTPQPLDRIAAVWDNLAQRVELFGVARSLPNFDAAVIAFFSDEEAIASELEGAARLVEVNTEGIRSDDE